MSHQDRREHERKSLEGLSVHFRKSNDKTATRKEAILLDVSKGGLAFLAHEKVIHGDPLLIEISFGGFKMKGIPGVVRHQKAVRDVTRINLQFQADLMESRFYDELRDLISVFSSTV